MWGGLIDQLGLIAGTVGTLGIKLVPTALGFEAKGLKSAFSLFVDSKAFRSYYSFSAGLQIAGAVITAGAIAVEIILTASGNVTDEVRIGLAVAKTVGAVLSVAGISAGLLIAKEAGKTFETLTASAEKLAGKIAIFALVAVTLVSVGIFVFQILSAQVGFVSLTFNQLFSGVYAGVVVGLIFFAIGAIPVVGALLIAIITLIDAVVLLICSISYPQDSTTTGDTFAQDYVCGGISGALTKLVEYLVYDQTPLVDLARSDRLNLTNIDIAVNPNDAIKGMVVGSSLNISMDVDTALYATDPISVEVVSPIFWPYSYQFSDTNVKDSVIDYALTTGPQPLHESMSFGDMASVWVSPTAPTPPTAPGWAADSTYVARVPNRQTTVTLTKPGINQSLSALVLSEGTLIHTQECWTIPNPIPPFLPPIIPICYLRDEGNTNDIPVGQNFIFDIFPAMVGEFMQLTARQNGSYALAWDSKFPALKDADGDGLISQAFGGNDPNDSLADTDSDGLSDSFEIKHGTPPTLADGDKDGLNDAAEYRLGTDPFLADTDGDGLHTLSGSPTLANVTFQGNRAVQGGGIYAESSSPSLTDVRFVANYSSDSGGGLYNTLSSPTLTRVIFSANVSNDGAGGMNSRGGGTAHLTDVTFSANQARTYASGLMILGNPVLDRVTFVANRVTAGYGGGMVTFNLTTPLTNLAFIGNQASGEAGGLYAVNDPKLTNVSFQGNSAGGDGGGLWASGFNTTLINTTFSGNHSGGNGGAVYAFNGPFIQNSLLWMNAAGGSNDELYINSGTGGIFNSLIKGSNDTSNGNLDGTNPANDPLFVTSVDRVRNRIFVSNRDAGNMRVLYRTEFGQWKNDGQNFTFGDRRVPFEVAYNPVNQKLYLLYVVDTTWSVDIWEMRAKDWFWKIGTVPVGQNGGSRSEYVGGTGLAVNTATGNVFVANAVDNSVSVISGSSNLVTATLATGSDPFYVAVNSLTRVVYVALRSVNRLAHFVDRY